ncbi:MAG: hypothetical protein IJE05_04755 [Clostridia bacterium]|nr:hypothetical protein [Clostridia bacterium]
MKINKIVAIFTLVILVTNIISTSIYVVEAEDIQNDIDKDINTISENNIENELAREESEDDISNETSENTIKDENTVDNNTEENTNKTNNDIEKDKKEETDEIENTEEIEKTENSEETKETEEIEEKQDDVQEDGIMLLSEEPKELGISYRTHVQNVGWQKYSKDGEMSGTSGRSLRLEGLNIKLENPISGLKIKYQVHIENVGWQGWKQDGEMAGTQGKSLRLEAMKIKLESSDEYSVMYRVHVQNIGWQDWKTDGEIAGTEGKSLRLEAIQIKIVPKVKKGMIHLQTPVNGYTYYSPTTIKIVGWKMSNVSNTKIQAYIDGSTTPIDQSLITYKQRSDVIATINGYGTIIENPNPGFEISVDATNMSSGTHTIKIQLCTSTNEKIQEMTTKINIDRALHVQYKSHVQNVGWQSYVLDGNISGTQGRALRVEAMNIKLINAPSNAKIIYRAHVQNVGWQNWKQNGELTGTERKSLRIEALQIKLENMDNYTVEYQVHIQDKGWSGWYIDGETAGTIGQAKRIEAVRIRLVPKYKRQYNGIDVSQFNGSINWGFVKRTGIDFAFIRVGYRGYGQAGNFKEDDNFRTNIQAAKQAGVPVGVYFVTQAITPAEAIEEAHWVLDKIKEYSLDYPIAIDIEAANVAPGDVPRTQNLDTNTRTYLAKLFCQTIQSAGYTPIIYANVDWATNKLNMSQLSEYDTWIASYRSGNPGYSGKYSIWQYTSKGTINGILGNVDLNISYKKY